MGPIEKEFDPTEFSAELVAVEHDESISSIMSHVSEALGRTPNVVLVIPRGSEAFHNTHDFLALSKLQWTGEARVSVASPDPTIAGLARVLGFHIVDPPADHPALAGDPSFDTTSQPDDTEQATSPLPLGGMPEWTLSPSIPVISRASSSLTTSTWLNMPDDRSELNTSAHTIKRAGVPPPRTRPRQTGVLLPTNIAVAPPLTPVIDPAKVNDPKTEDGDAKARRAIIDARAYRNGRRWRYNSAGRPMRWSRVVAVLAVLLVVSLVAGSAYAYVYLPEGTISVTPLGKTYPLTVDVAVLTTPSQAGKQTNTQVGGTDSSSNTLTGTPINGIQFTAPLSVEGTITATGTRQMPTGRAHGTMHFANTTSLAKNVPAGTQFNAPNGVIVETTQGVTVPPTDLLAGTVGAANVPVVANIDGPGGNMAAGQLAGIYANALQYTNTALTGGSLETVNVVTQADIDGLTGTLTAKINSEVEGAISHQLQAGQQFITQTVALTGTQIQSDHKANDDADSVKVTVSGVAMGYAYSTSDMDSAITGAVTDWVRTSSDIPADAGPQLTGDITHGAVTLVSFDNATQQAVYASRAVAPVHFTLTPGMSTKIRSLVAGQDIAKAKELITQTYGGYLDAGSIQAKVLWFSTGKLPSDPDHIVVQLGSSAPGTAGALQPSQQPQRNARPAQR